MGPTKAQLKEAVQLEIERRAAEIIEISRRILSQPETGFFEFQTAHLVEKEFEQMGLKFQSGLARTGG